MTAIVLKRDGLKRFSHVKSLEESATEIVLNIRMDSYSEVINIEKFEVVKMELIPT